MYKYFHNFRTAEDVKHQYRENAKKYHPDLGGNPEDFKAMRLEYERLWAQYKNVHRTWKSLYCTGSTLRNSTYVKYVLNTEDRIFVSSTCPLS